MTTTTLYCEGCEEPGTRRPDGYVFCDPCNEAINEADGFLDDEREARS